MNFPYASIAFLLLTLGHAHGQDLFHLYAPDTRGGQLIVLTVEDQQDKIAIEQKAVLKLNFGPGSVTLNHARDRLYAASSGRNSGAVASVKLKKNGAMELMDSAKLAHRLGYTSVDRGDKFLLSANYSAGMVTVHRLTEKGTVGDAVCSLTTPRQEAHCILTTPDNRFAYVPCVKNNNGLFQFSFDDVSGELTPLKVPDAKPPAMFGPRHYVYHPTLPIVYFSNEQQLGVSVFQIDSSGTGSSGQLTDIQHAVTTPRRSPFEKGKRDLHASDLVVSQDGKRLWVAVRDFNGDEDRVYTFAVQDDGKLRLLTSTKVGDIPWKIGQSPDGKLLLVSESGDRTLGVYRIAPEGSLELAGRFDWKMAARDFVVRKPN